MAGFELITGLYAAGVQIAAVVVLVYVVVALMGAGRLATPLTHSHDADEQRPRARRG
jgi:hypothetical protein